MAHVKGSGSVKQQSQKKRSGKRLGIKKFGGEDVIPGNIIVKQRGRKYKPGRGVKIGRDDTIFSVIKGKVKFSKKFGKTVVNVI